MAMILIVAVILIAGCLVLFASRKGKEKITEEKQIEYSEDSYMENRRRGLPKVIVLPKTMFRNGGIKTNPDYARRRREEEEEREERRKREEDEPPNGRHVHQNPLNDLNPLDELNIIDEQLNPFH